MRDLGHANFGVAHRRGRVSINGAEIPLAIHQWVAEREILRHANNRVVDGRIAMRVVFTDDVTNDSRGLFIRFVPVVIQLVHGEQDPAVDRFETITDVG